MKSLIMPESMQALLVEEPGGPEQLQLGTAPKPTPGPEEVLVRVHATALNRADTLQRRGKYPPPEGASSILGLEMAGVVEATGKRVAHLNAGDRVFGLLPGGGYAGYAVIHREMAMAVPPGLSLEEAAAIPEVFLTAFQALHWLGALEGGEHALIHAGGSGVGTAAIQLARLAGARVAITASAPKHEVCRTLGAKTTIDYKTEDFAARVEDVTGGDGVDLIIDFIGAPYFEKNIQSLAVDGRLVLLATLGGSRLESVDLRSFFQKRIQLFVSTLRSRSLEYKIRLTQDFAAYALPAFVDGDLCPVIDRVYDWTEAVAAHRCMEANENTGKLVLRVR